MEKVRAKACGDLGRKEEVGFGCPPGIRTPISRSRICCPTIERGGNSRRETRRSATCDSMGVRRCGQYRRRFAAISHEVILYALP